MNDPGNDALNDAVPARRPILAVGAVVRNTAGDILIVRRGRPPRLGEWSIPGGKVEWGERPTDALVREIEEETGLTVAIAGLIEVVDSPIRDAGGALTHHYVLLDYAVRVVSGELRAGGDVTEARWVPFARLGDYPMWSETRRIIEAATAL